MVKLRRFMCFYYKIGRALLLNLGMRIDVLLNVKARIHDYRDCRIRFAFSVVETSLVYYLELISMM